MKLWQFLGEKNNRDIISWIGGGTVALAGLGWRAFGWFGPKQVAPIDLQPQPTPQVMTSKCKAAGDIVTRTEGFVIHDSHLRKIEAGEIALLTKCQKWIARNEIFARKGRPFSNTMLQTHFDKQTWYKPVLDFPALSEIEMSNVQKIQLVESRSQ